MLVTSWIEILYINKELIILILLLLTFIAPCLFLKLTLIPSFLLLLFIVFIFFPFSSTYIISGSLKLQSIQYTNNQENYIPRVEVETHLNNVIGKRDHKYSIIIGPKGCGKSTVLKNVIKGKPGIIYVKIDSETKNHEIGHKIFKEFSFIFFDLGNVDLFKDICEYFKEKSNFGWIPTIIFDIHEDTKPEIIHEIFKISKEISRDKLLAKSLIVLNDPNLIPFILLDSNLHNYISIPDFTKKESHYFLTKNNFTNDLKIRNKVFDNIGTRPSDLKQLVDSKMKIDHYIKEKIQSDFKIVENLMKTDDFYIQILKKLVKEGNQNGMNENDVLDTMSRSKSNLLNEDAIKFLKILYYNPETFKFKFHSTSMFQATKLFLKGNGIDRFMVCDILLYFLFVVMGFSILGFTGTILVSCGLIGK